MRATIQQDSDGILRKQSLIEKMSHVQLRLHLTEERFKLTDAAVFLVCNSYLGTVMTLGVLIYNRHLAALPVDIIGSVKSFPFIFSVSVYFPSITGYEKQLIGCALYCDSCFWTNA